jgi:hypothetical protein
MVGIDEREMIQKEFIENRDQVGAEGRKQATVRVTHLTHENQPAFIADSSKSRALWRLSLVLKEIAGNSKPRDDEKQKPRRIPAKDGDGGCNIRNNGVYIISNP